MANLEDTYKFVSWWFSCVPADSIFEIRRRRDGGVTKDFFTSLPEVMEFCKKNITFTGDWWYGLQPRKDRGGKTENIKQFVFYGEDFDHTSKTENGTPQNTYDIIRKWGSYPLNSLLEDEQISAAVSLSGNCAQVILRHSPKILDEETCKQHARQTMELGEKILVLVPLNGLYIDEVKDAARVLRLPGFANPKGGRDAELLFINIPSKASDNVDFKQKKMPQSLDKAFAVKVGSHKRYGYLISLVGLMASARFPFDDAKSKLDEYTQTMCEWPEGEGTRMRYIENCLTRDAYERWLKTNKPLEGKESDEVLTDEILLNPIRQTDRFGAGLKNGLPYFGIPVCTKNGELLPAVVCAKKFIFGTENLQAAGFDFSADFSMASPETWNREKVYDFIKNPREGKSTKELLERLIALNKRILWHPNEATHSVVAAYIMMTYIYFAFKQIPRMVFVGLPDSGKSLQTDLIAKCALNPLTSADASKASISRLVEVLAGVVEIDNFDNITDENKFIFAQLYDTSFEEGRPIFRVEDMDGKKSPKAFRTLCPMIVNCTSVGWMKTSSRTRTILVRMMINSNAKLDKIKTIEEDEFEELKDELRIWGLENATKLNQQEIPTDFSNRQSDIARPIIAILNDAGVEHLKTGIQYLTEQFQEFREDENDTITEHLLAIWKLSVDDADHLGEVSVSAGRVAEEVLTKRGYAEIDERGAQNKMWPKLKQQEAIFAGNVLMSCPYEKKTHPGNVSTYHLKVRKLAAFMQTRGYDIGAKGTNMLQGTLNP